MYNIGVIGDYYSISGFSSVGFNTFPVETVEEARNKLDELARNGYGIIYITEAYMEKLQDDCKIYNEEKTPCIIPIPASSGVTGVGESRLKACVEKAVGSDIVFDK